MMERIVDLTMTHLFRLAEQVLTKFDVAQRAPAAVQDADPIVPTIRFTNEDKMVEGELFAN